MPKSLNTVIVIKISEAKIMCNDRDLARAYSLSLHLALHVGLTFDLAVCVFDSKKNTSSISYLISPLVPCG